MNLRSPFAALALAAIAIGGVATIPAGCNHRPGVEKTAGSISMRLSLPDGTTIDTIHYKITHSNGYLNEGDIPVANSTTVAFQIGGIPRASGYSLTLTATTSSSVSCNAG